MKLVKFLTALTVVFGLAATAGAQTTTPVIAAGIGMGNGEFEITDISQTSLVNAADGAMGQFIMDNPRFLFLSGANFGPAPLDLFDLSTVTDGLGVVIDGWTNYRTEYTASNPAHGFDGGFAFEAAAGEPLSGQAFTNAGSMALLSDAHPVAGAGIGDSFDLAFFVGSDQSSVTDYRSFLVFDDTTVVELTNASATDVAQDNFNRDLTAADAALELSDTFVTTAPYTTVRVMIVGEADVPLNRALVDNVRLDVTTSGGPILLGDVDLNGVVNFLDIQAFIDVLSGNGFQDEADIDLDGAVTFLDIQPFIEILASPTP